MKFVVIIPAVYTQEVEVEAETAADALKQIACGRGRRRWFSRKYVRTLAPDTWTVEQAYEAPGEYSNGE